MTREEALKELRGFIGQLTEGCQEAIKVLIPELVENEDEIHKNKSGYYKAGKFWKASTLWNAVKGKSPQRVPNRYILQECTWNISSLQHFANEVKNIQEADLNYPIILDMNGNILDGAHRVVKAYLEGKDIDIVYLGDDEWPEPDYDEEKAVKVSKDERTRKEIIKFIQDFCNPCDPDCDKWIAWLEKQKEQKDYRKLYEDIAKSEWFKKAYAGKSLGEEDDKEEQKPKEPGYKHEDYFCERCQANAFKAGRESVLKEQKPTDKSINWTELTWKDIVELEGIINNVHYDFSGGIGQESFGKEVLERFRSKKDDAEVDACEQKPTEKEIILSKLPDYTPTNLSPYIEHGQEWTEEDERMLSHCIKSVECSKQFADLEKNSK